MPFIFDATTSFLRQFPCFIFKAVPLFHFDRHRLHLVLKSYVQSKNVLTPLGVVQQEVLFPGMKPDDTHLCKTYILDVFLGRVYLIFLHDATGEDLVKGMLDAHLVHSQPFTDPLVPHDGDVIVAA